MPVKDFQVFFQQNTGNEIEFEKSSAYIIVLVLRDKINFAVLQGHNTIFTRHLVIKAANGNHRLRLPEEPVGDGLVVDKVVTMKKAGFDEVKLIVHLIHLQ